MCNSFLLKIYKKDFLSTRFIGHSSNLNWYEPTKLGRFCGGECVIVKCAEKNPFRLIFESNSSDNHLLCSAIISNTCDKVNIFESEFLLGLGEGNERITSASRLNTFLGGRIALRESIREVTGDDMNYLQPILRNSFGAPLLPPDVTGCPYISYFTYIHYISIIHTYIHR